MTNTNNTGKTVTFRGDFSNGPKTGVVTQDDGSWMTVQWNDGKTTHAPSGLVRTPNWSVS